MNSDKIRHLLKDKIVCDFRGYPLGTIRRVWFDDQEGPLVIVERNGPASRVPIWEAIPLRAIDRVGEQVRLRPPVFAE